MISQALLMIQIQANDYGLVDEETKTLNDKSNVSDSVRSPAVVQVAFKKRGKKRKARNIRSATGLN